MKNKAPLIVALFAVGFLCFGTEPNDVSSSGHRSIEARLLVLEQRVDTLEQQVGRLQARRPGPSLSAPSDPNKDDLRIERLSKQIQESKENIVLTEKKIVELPPKWISQVPFKFSKESIPEVIRILEVAKENRNLLNDQVRSYNKIVQLAERNPDLGVDVMEMKKNLIRCQGRQRSADDNLDRVRELIQYNRELWSGNTPR